MPFFPQAYLSPEASFLHLISELDNAAPQSGKQCPAARGRHCQPRRPQETFTPSFDVTESAQAYELFGELPGLAQEDLSIEFSDVQTIVIKGKTARPSTTTEAKGKAPEVTEKEVTDTASEKSHTATVEDDYDEVDTPLAATPATTAPATVSEEKAEAKTEEAEPRFWVSERKVGTFARSFSFSQRVELDNVQASLKNGVLHIVVPKTLKGKKVNVNVA
jgi:HSP20 family protein